MEQVEPVKNTPPFNEEAWIKLIFLLSDTQDWLNQLASGALMQVPMKNRKRLLRKTYYLPLASLSHILERHHYKIPRHPGTGKFTIPVPEILSYLRDILSMNGCDRQGCEQQERVDFHNMRLGE
jgi:hypothetical protein